ncbi:MAG: FecR/PupR family sigma factor regulator [Butyricimonas virosa]
MGIDMAISDYMEDLIYRVLAGEVDEVERKKFETWLRENDEHRVFFEKIERAWYTGKMPRWKNVEMSAAWKAVEHGREQRQRRRFRRIVGCGSERGGVGRNNMDCGTERRRIPCFGCGSIFGGKTG